MSFAQEKSPVPEQEIDTARAYIGEESTKAELFQKDTIVETPNDFSPLDIGSNRGIFILSANKLLQLRILGSVRANFHYTDTELEDQNTFNPYEIPTNGSGVIPVYFAGVNQTRLGFEVTRRTRTRGDIFIRLEGDFKGSSGGYRIRHAYGEIGRFLGGQTWSLTNNVGYQPALVSLDGPVGGIGIRTPQIRYTSRIKKVGFSVALEYSQPQVQIPDSINASIVQVTPDLTGRLTYNVERLSMRFATAITTISGKLNDNNIASTFGYLVTLAGKLSSVKGGDLFFSLTNGLATSHFLDTFNGKNIDLVFNSETGQFEPLQYTGGYVAYNHALPKNFSTSISFGVTKVHNKSFQKDQDFSHSYNALLNIFWQPTEGARIGLEFANGQRFDHRNTDGMANRISALMYYDF